MMWTTVTSDAKTINDYQFRRVTIDLTQGEIRHKAVAYEDMEDFLGGIGRSFKLLGHYHVDQAFAPDAPLIMNLGVFSGTDMMTGLRIFFSAYSPLKVTNNGRPLAMWSTAASTILATTLLVCANLQVRPIVSSSLRSKHCMASM